MSPARLYSYDMETATAISAKATPRRALCSSICDFRPAYLCGIENISQFRGVTGESKTLLRCPRPASLIMQSSDREEDETHSRLLSGLVCLPLLQYFT